MPSSTFAITYTEDVLRFVKLQVARSPEWDKGLAAMPGRLNRRRVLCFSHIKGGVAKTTCCVNVGAGLAAMGFKTLLIDMDPQSSLTDVFLGGAELPEKSIYNVLYSDKDSHGQLPITEVIQNIGENLDIAPANLDLVRLEHLLLPEVDGRDRLRRAIRGLEYDFIVIDTSPSVGLLTSNAMIAASDLIIPVQASYFALKGIENIMETFNTIKERVNESLNLLGVVITMVDKRKRHPLDVIADLGEIFPRELIFNTQIREVAKVEASPGYHQDIFKYAPHSIGAEDFHAFIGEILTRCQNS
jgi:chromosome partitioning protein